MESSSTTLKSCGSSAFWTSRAWLPAKVHHGLFECYQCSGFWCGALLGSLLVGMNPATLFACGCAGSFVADISESLFKYLESSNAS